MITTKDNMCENAILMFKELGYENVSINMICKKLNVTRGSFYHHFENKNDLLLYWFSSQVQKNIAIDMSLESPKQILKQYNLDYANFIKSVGNDFMYHILLEEFRIGGKHFYTYLTAESQSIELINKAIEKNEIHSTKSPEELIETYISAIIGLIVTWNFEKAQFDLVNKVESIFESIYR